jgi:uncharacterized protein (TIGR02996 family)
VNEDEAFIRAIVDSPGDDLLRLVYADWLDDHEDPRGPYLRAELEWAKKPAQAAMKKVQRLAKALDTVWVARVSRPPVGICLHSASVFEKGTRGPQLSLSDIENWGSQFGGLPADYTAFLLNYNGGDLTESVDVGGYEISGFVTINGKFTLDNLLRHLSDGGLLC